VIPGLVGLLAAVTALPTGTDVDFDECDRHVDDDGDQVLMIEYRADDVGRTCAAYSASHAVVLRDRDLTPTGVHRWC
jgi:hypothetical protein